MKRSFVWIAGLALALVGCGGGESVTTSEVSGTVYDSGGLPVNNVHIYYGRTNTYTSSNGGYVLSTLPADNVLIRAEVTRNGTRYYGQNVALTFNGERTKSVNIVVYPDDTIAQIHGVVHDRNGHVIQGARVFARDVANNTLSGATAISNEAGEYRIDGLSSSITYRVLCNASGFATDSDSITLNSGQDLLTDFLIGDGTITTPNVPTNLLAESWTTPFSATRSAAYSRAVQNLKSFVHRRSNRTVKTATARNTANGNWIEIDLTWNALDANNLLGYGIYRGSNANSLRSIDFLRDPLAEIFEDLDSNLGESQTYYYAISALSTSYTSNGSGESALSSTVSAVTLPDVTNPAVSLTPVTISWSPVTGATAYAVHVYDEYPTIGVTPVYNNYNSPIMSTSLVYPNSLISGHKYYYMIQALAHFDQTVDNGTGAYLSNSLSTVGSFIAP